MNYKLISIDLAKTVFQVAAFNPDSTIAFNRKINRPALLDMLRQCEPTLVAMEACYSANYWGRAIEKLGHTVKFIPARMVKAMLVGNKNDANDAIAIGETACRPTVSLLRPKTVEQQDIQSLLLILEDADNELSTVARGFIQRLYEFQLCLNDQIDQAGQDILTLAQAMPLYPLLLTIPGVDFIVASTLLASINEVNDFKNGRQLAAWLGLTPSQYRSGTTNRLGKIIKRSGDYLSMVQEPW